MPKLLVVDDEPDLLRAIAQAVAASGDEFAVQTALTAEDALGIVQRHPIDILLTDVLLPGMDGIELVQRVLATSPKTKVIVMTALHSPEVQSRAVEGGALRYMQKPFALPALVDVLREVSAAGGWSGSVSGLDIFDLTQLLAMTQRSRSVRVRAGTKTGVLVLKDGQLTHSTANGRSGPDAFYEMVCWDGGTFEDIPQADVAAYPRNVEVSTAHLILEAARLRDEARAPAPATAPATAGPLTGKLKELLGNGGFVCDACIVAPDGTVVAQHSGRAGKRRPISDVADTLHQHVSALGRPSLRRLLLEDDEETVVLCDVPGAAALRLLLIADCGPRMGGVLAEARRLAQALRPPESEG
jgi:CheY-like chemotaxis protein